MPFEQLLFSGVKLGLVALFAVFALHNGIVFAWVAPAALAVLVISPLLLVRVLPAAPPRTARQLPGRRDLAVLFVGEYATGATSVIVPLFMPLIVVAQLGTQKPTPTTRCRGWSAEAITVLLWNVSSSYITEASNDVAQRAPR